MYPFCGLHGKCLFSIFVKYNFTCRIEMNDFLHNLNQLDISEAFDNYFFIVAFKVGGKIRNIFFNNKLNNNLNLWIKDL